MSQNEEKIARFKKMLLDMKQDYLVALPKRIILIRDLTDKENWKDLNEEFHKLKGTGKTYGFPEISIVCEILETLSGKDRVPSPDVFKKVPDLFERMYQTYLQNQPFPLEQDDFARSLLALK